jgi:hypothetical protein
VISMDGSTGRIWTEAVSIIHGTTNGVIREFNDLVVQTLGIVPVIFGVPEEPVSEALLYLGDKVLGADAVSTVTKTLDKVGRLYLDLVPSEAEERFLNIVGAHGHTQRLVSKLENLLAGSEKFTQLIVIAKQDITTSFQRIAIGSDLRSLVLSEQEIVLDGIDTTDPAVQRVLFWKKAEGVLKVVSIGSFLPGAKSMVSVPQALQILGEVV